MLTFKNPGLILLAIIVMTAACKKAPQENDGTPEAAPPEASTAYDGSDYSTETEKVLHGKRLAQLLGCEPCHMKDYSGANFGEVIPLLKGLWSTNISLTMPGMTDQELEYVLRTGAHPDRELYLMNSKQSQFLSERDMRALIAFLRTIPPTGEPTPLPPPGFKDSVNTRLPPDYKRIINGVPVYHSAAEEVDFFRENAAPFLGEEYAQGHLIALTICTSCHGAALDGIGESAGGIESALDFDETEFLKFLREDSVSGHAPEALTFNEVEAVMRYTKELARIRRENQQQEN